MSQASCQPNFFTEQSEEQESAQLPVNNQQNHLVMVQDDLLEPRPDNIHEMDADTLLALAAHALPPALQLRH